MFFKLQRFKKVGESYNGFTLTKMTELPEIHCSLHELIHQASGAHVLHIGNDDPENLFCLSFRTWPDTSNGVAHILEHTVLCGSQKFPVKDPFFAMNRRSLNTFMNALTGSDFTCYPAASQVHKDFYNLLDVYLDAVFHPNLNLFSFLQEGHRLEFDTPSDPTTPLRYKGIVFNEMKGALNSPSTRLAEALHEHLFPDLTYHVNSGGDPKVIPTLTYEQLKAFHAQYYHPSRCLFFFYGNMPLEPHLDFIAERTLNKTIKAEALPPLSRQPKFQKPIEKQAPYPIGAEENPADRTLIALAWLTCHILEQEELLALMVLDIILMDTDASLLKMALLKSGLCKQASSSIDGEMSEVPFALVFKGCNASAAQPLLELVLTTLSQVVSQGIPDALIESALHQLEIQRSEITGDQAPYGLTLFMRSALLNQHGGAPEAGLKIHSLFETLRNNLQKNHDYLQQLIKKHFLDNPHRLLVTLIPDPQLTKKEEKEEEEALKIIRAKLSPEQEKELIKTAAKLSVFQEEQEHQDIDILPKVTLADVPKRSRDYPLTRTKAGNLELFHHDCFTNQLLYVDLVYSLPAVKPQDLSLVRLFTWMIAEVGCGGRSYAQNLEYIQEHTGGVGAALATNVQASNQHLFIPSLHLQGKALYRKADKLFPLLGDMVTSLDFNDVNRLKELLLKHYTNLEHAMNSNAMKYASNLSSSALSASSQIANHWYGLEYYWRIKALVKDFDAQADELVTQLKTLSKQLLGLQGAHLVITCDKYLVDQLIKQEFYGAAHLPTKNYLTWKNPLQPPVIVDQGRIIPSSVAFTAKAVPTLPYTHPSSAALALAAYICDNTTLHTRIREQGGAYGGGASCHSLSGNFSFYAYRDPHIAKTLSAFEEAVEKVATGKWEESDLEEAKLELIQALDAPIAPGSRGDTAYGWWREGRDLGTRQAFRDNALAATRQQVIEAVATHLRPQLSQGKNIVFAGKELLEKENRALTAAGHPLQILTI